MVARWAVVPILLEERISHAKTTVPMRRSGGLIILLINSMAVYIVVQPPCCNETARAIKVYWFKPANGIKPILEKRIIVIILLMRYKNNLHPFRRMARQSEHIIHNTNNKHGRHDKQCEPGQVKYQQIKRTNKREKHSIHNTNE